jgi:hypothetical protein
MSESTELLMPSDMKKAPAAAPLPEPPSVKMVVRLFVIPLLIAAAVVAIMVPIGWMAGGKMTLDHALDLLENPGGERTAGQLVGPGSKQRFIAAKAVVDHMKEGMDEAQRIKLAGRLVNILEKHTKADEGDVRQFLLLALGRVWQITPGQPPMNSEAAVESRQRVLESMKRFFDEKEKPARLAAMLAVAMWRGQPEAREAIAALVKTVGDGQEDLDVRIAAAVALGAVGDRDDQRVIDALNAARSVDEKDAELGWNAALALTRMGREDARPTLLMLLDRQQLAQLRVYDREADPQNPVFRQLNELEQQRFLLNAMEAAREVQDAQVRARLKQIADSDPSTRVRTAAVELMK